MGRHVGGSWAQGSRLCRPPGRAAELNEPRIHGACASPLSPAPDQVLPLSTRATELSGIFPEGVWEYHRERRSATQDERLLFEAPPPGQWRSAASRTAGSSTS